MTSPKPTIIFVPGLWEGPEVFNQVASALNSHSYPTLYAPLDSTGTTSPGNPSMDDDTAAIRAVIAPVVKAGKNVILVCHSAGGFLGSAAVEGLKVGSVEGGGGVEKIVLLAAGVAPAGYVHEDRPFMDFQGDKMFCHSPVQLLFNDLPPSSHADLIASLKCQPASGWNQVTTYAGWTEIPSVYVVATQDACLPPAFQQQFAAMTGGEKVEIDAGHMVMLSQPEKVVEVIRRAAGEAL
ncbi:alpha/beta-hydrolase [Pseudohyphozyma bogoriensis]|nr:alpha/beta-hydrolase [Pseudohyphozyma bogoriensis]